MNAIKIFTLSLLYFLFIATKPVFSWGPITHKYTSEILPKYLPSLYANIIKTNKKSYLNGAASSNELLDVALKEQKSSEYSKIQISALTIEKITEQLQILQSVINGNTATSGRAYELGVTFSYLFDFLYPLPYPETEKKFLETLSAKLRLDKTVDTNIKKFKFQFDNYSYQKSIPYFLSEIFEKQQKYGSTIFDNYNNTGNYDNVSVLLQEAFNSALNAIIDIFYSVFTESRNNKKFNIREILGIERFNIETPKTKLIIPKPSSPTPPRVEKKKEQSK